MTKSIQNIKSGFIFASFVKTWSLILRIDSTFSQPSIHQPLGNDKQSQTPKQTPKDTTKLTPTHNAQRIKDKEEKEDSTQTQKTQNDNDKPKNRQTYGLMILEMMSDTEYATFQRATAGMSEGEKIMAAQSLYSLTEFYQGQHDKKPKNPYTKTNKAFGRHQNFLEQYKAIYKGAKEVNLLS